MSCVIRADARELTYSHSTIAAWRVNGGQGGVDGSVRHRTVSYSMTRIDQCKRRKTGKDRKAPGLPLLVSY